MSTYLSMICELLHSLKLPPTVRGLGQGSSTTDLTPDRPCMHGWHLPPTQQSLWLRVTPKFLDDFPAEYGAFLCILHHSLQESVRIVSGTLNLNRNSSGCWPWWILSISIPCQAFVRCHWRPRNRIFNPLKGRHFRGRGVSKAYIEVEWFGRACGLRQDEPDIRSLMIPGDIVGINTNWRLKLWVTL